jgi:hypothetical protein
MRHRGLASMSEPTKVLQGRVGIRLKLVTKPEQDPEARKRE